MTKGLDLASENKNEAFQKTADFLTGRGYEIVKLDLLRPWGFFFYIDSEQTKKFIQDFYGEAELIGIDTNLPLQPKILGIEPGKRLSWQYHHRRAEIWQCIVGPYGLITSETDEQPEPVTVSQGEIKSMACGVRHRGVGLDGWGIVAEIWQHTDPNNPSDEDDIIRLSDDFNRN